MPPKQVVCSICGKTVNKAKTYCVNAKTGERACKVHEGVAQKKEELQAQQKARKADERRKETNKPWKRSRPEPVFGPQCWLCHKPGLRQDEWGARYMIAEAKVRNKYPDMANAVSALVNLTHGKEKAERFWKLMRKEFLLPGESEDMFRMIMLLPDSPDDPKMKKVFAMLDSPGKEAARFGGFIALCSHCADKYGVRPQAPKIDEKSLKTMFLIGRMVGDRVDEVAKQELRKEAEAN